MTSLFQRHILEHIAERIEGGEIDTSQPHVTALVVGKIRIVHMIRNSFFRVFVGNQQPMEFRTPEQLIEWIQTKGVISNDRGQISAGDRNDQPSTTVSIG